MCDYSLRDVASRPAKVGDKLTTRKFDNYSRGFAADGEPNIAVCLRPGTEVAFEEAAEYDHTLRRILPRFGFGKLAGKVARFRQINPNQHGVHHDALEFSNGGVVLLTRLCPGQRATVLQLPAAHLAAAKETHVVSATIDGHRADA
jgi:hypothetical protein